MKKTETTQNKKLYPNFFQLIKQLILGVGIGIFPFYIISTYINKGETSFDYKLLVIIILAILSIYLIVSSIAKSLFMRIIINDTSITIKSITKKIEISIKNIVRVKKMVKRGKDTSIFGKSIFEIHTMKETHKLTSEEFLGLDYLKEHLGHRRNEV